MKSENFAGDDNDEGTGHVPINKLQKEVIARTLRLLLGKCLEYFILLLLPRTAMVRRYRSHSGMYSSLKDTYNFVVRGRWCSRLFQYIRYVTSRVQYWTRPPRPIEQNYDDDAEIIKYEGLINTMARSGLAKGANKGHITEERTLAPKPSHRKGVSNSILIASHASESRSSRSH